MASKVKSTLYSAVGVYSNQVLSFVTAAILGRLLEPKDFGLVALLLLVNGFLSLFASAGVSSVIIQFRDLGQRELKALVGLCWIIGLVLMLGSIAAAQPLAAFFSSPQLTEIIPVGAFALLLTPVAQVVDGVLIREDRFGARATVAIMSALAGSVVGISLALLGYGYWALVIQLIVRPFFALVFGFLSIRMFPLPSVNLSLYRRVGNYAANLVGFRFLNYWTQNLDNLLIGKSIGIAELGYYSRAYALFNLSTNIIQGVTGPVLHSSFAKVKNDPAALKKEIASTLSVIALISMPMMAVASIYSEEIIRAAWGPKWDLAVLPFSLLAIAGMFRPVQAVSGEVMKALGRTGELLGWGLFRLGLYAVAIILGLKAGILGVACGVLVASILNWAIFSNFVLLRCTNLTTPELFCYYYPALKLLIWMACTAYGLKYFVFPTFGDISRLLFSIPLLLMVYLLICWRQKNKIFEIIFAIKRKIMLSYGRT